MGVYLIGAGASTPYGAPITRELLSEAFLGWSIQPPQVPDGKENYQRVAKEIDRRYCTDLLQAMTGNQPLSAKALIALQKVNIEDLLSISDEENDSELRRAMEWVIFKTLEGSIRRSEGEYNKLVAKIAASNEKTCLISFNYDVLLDQALADESRNSNLSWSYGIPFNASIEKFPSYEQHLHNEPQVLLLKLHGSLNWSQCINCEALRLHYFRKYRNLFASGWPKCEICSSEGFKPILVAPTPLKVFPQALDELWKLAAERLQKATELTVIGYSFPVNDRRSRELFLRNFIVHNLDADVQDRPMLTIVTPRSSTQENIKEWFSPSFSDVDFYDSFEKYCEED